MSRPRFGRLLAAVLLYLVFKVILYRAAGLFEVAPNASAWYPPIGLMLAFVLYGGPAALPFLLVPSDLLAYGTVNGFSLLIIPQALVVGATGLALRRGLGGDVFGSAKGIGVFMVAALAAVSLLLVLSTAAVQAITAQRIAIAGNVNFAYWLGDLSGLLLCTPVFLAIFRLIQPPPGEVDRWLSPDMGTVLRAAALSAAGLLAWSLTHDRMATPASAVFLLILPIATAGFLWGFAASTLTAFLTNGGLVLTMHGTLAPSEAVDLQVFMLAAGATGLLLGALGSTRMELLGRNAQLVRAIEEAPLGIALLERRREAGVRVAFANRTFRRFDPDIAPVARRLTHGQGLEVDVERAGRTLAWMVKPASASPSGETMIAIVQDVTEQRRKEQADQHQRRMVAIGEIAGGMAHELNNLLHPVLNLSQQARSDAATRPERLGRALAIIEDSARSAAKLVRQVLSFARGSDRDEEGAELVSAVRDVTALLDATLPPTFTTTLTSEVSEVPVRLTRTEIGQIVTNLAVNALDATGQKGHLRIRVGRPAGGFVTMTVEDDGPGIPAPDAERVMEPFFTTKPHGQGTGLGLAVVQDLLLRRGSGIRLVTQAPQGARFVLTLAEHC
ncbi:two-component sensor histidine kinase [Azospirillum formosense]|uniref:histidine kinase n=1 Tax=Azospirillum formosense TaxID=861533 RepID=A0ABX2KS48_9PROT|nr:ATP-binding protein [Azospirillum formosense]MBY3754971.1 two-component sensor histidine kinase [Azospirillum formosense]NUB19448.1 two-component sensor histidine kinase [Azospirillum formosense]